VGRDHPVLSVGHLVERENAHKRKLSFSRRDLCRKSLERDGRRNPTHEHASVIGEKQAEVEEAKGAA